MTRRVLALLCFGILACSLVGQDVSALTQFKKTFDSVYVRDSDDDEFKQLYRKNACNVCHVKGKKRDVVNAYGMELADLIPGNAKQRLAEARDVSSEAKEAEEERILKELEAALKKVENVKLPTGETYGDILRSHRLPLGEAAGSVAADEEDG
jgi:hypothetical protein